MKKLISFLALTLCLAVFVLAFGVSAVNPPTVNVKINGISVPESGGKISGNGIDGNISYDASTETLTLDNATLTVDGETGIDIVYGVHNIVLKGTNEIKWADDDIGMQHTAIKSQNNIINISGSGVSDSLKITAVCTTTTDKNASNHNYLLCMPKGVSINNCSLDILLTPNFQDNSRSCDFTAIHSASGSVSIQNSRVNIVVGKDKAGNIKYSGWGACIFAEYILEITSSEVNAGFYSTTHGSQATLHGASGINITNSIVNAISDITNALKFDRSRANTVIKDSIVNASTPYYVARLLTGNKIIIENSNVEFASGNYVIAGYGNISGFTSISYTDENGNVVTGTSGTDLNLNYIRTLSVKTAHTHCVCGNLTHTSDVLHSAISWTAWDSATSLPTKPGNYYLTQNVTLAGVWNPSGAYNLCLNGKTVTNSRGTVINLSSAGSNVSVCDCTGGGTISGGGARNYAVSVGANTAFDLHGGKIVSSGAGCVSVTRSTGSFNIYGGTVGVGTESDHAVDLTYGGILNANGGTVNGKVDARNGKLNFGGTEFTSEIMVCHETPVSGTPILSGNGQLVYYYNVSIGSGDTKTEITSKNKDDILGNGKLSFEYDATAKKGTLTMNGVSLESDTYSPISASKINTLEIVLNGKNRVSSPDNYCIIAQNLIFSGDGSLSVTTTEPYSVCIDCTGDITVNGGNITLSSVSYAIYIDGALTVNNGSIIIIATDEEGGVALDYGSSTPDISISSNHMMLTGKMPNGSDAAETATTETDKISAARYIKILNSVAISYLPGADGSGNGSTVNKIPGIDFTLAGALFTRTGYTQTGWAITDGGEKIYDLGGIYTGNDPLTLYPVWTPNRYTITFDTDGGSAIDPITADYGTAVTAPAAPTKTGYTFAGWDTEIPATIPDQNITVKATWTINRYTISFDTDGGNEIASITQDYGTTVTAPANPTKVGYTFAGWDKEVPATMPAENVTLKAKWTINKYTISFDTDGGSDVASITQDYGTTVTAPANPTKVGYTFVGWDKEVPATMPAENVTLKAKWTINKYTITFDTDGGSEIASITQDYGTTVTAPANPTKVGYTFAGWDKEVPATMPAENITLKAIWKVCDHSGNKNALTCANDVNCSVCGATLAALAHTPEMDDLDCSTPVLCKVCGQVVTPGMRHSFGDRWYSDETTHWHFCSNGLCFVKSAISTHDWVDVPALAPTKTEDGYTAHRECTVCGAKCGYEVVPAHEIIRGDFDDNGVVDKKDAIYLLRHTIMGELYPLNQSGDMNGDGVVDKNDAVYLLRYTLLPKLYPLK